MFTGWWPSLKFKLDRPLTDEEEKTALPRQVSAQDSFDDRGALVGLNSTYIEWIDRRFLVRGSINTALVFLGVIFFILWIFYFFYDAINHIYNREYFFSSLICSVAGLVGAPLLYYAQPRLDFFKKIYYPIRFNRKNRMVYVYRDPKDGGILSVPWDKVFFHVGRGMKNTNFCDIRGEVLDGKTVKDTFALGHFNSDPRAIQQMWCFICRYMDGGPDEVGGNPLDRYMTLSVSPSLRNSLMMAYGFYDAPNMVIRIISLPFIVLTTITRWLVFKTCSMPMWPAEIDVACKVEPNDPNVWPTPRYTGQFAADNPALVARAREKVKAAAVPSELADTLGDWRKDMHRKK